MLKQVIIIILLVFSTLVFALDFSEDWESGVFTTNNWTFENDSGNWQVWEYFGNPGYSARFAGFPTMQDYDHRLVSPILDGTSSEDVIIDYDLFGRVMMAGLENLSIEIRTFGGEWQNVASYDSNTPGDEMTWLSESIQVSEYAAGCSFQICLHTYGSDSMNLIRWHVDNIHVYEPQPEGLPFLETWSVGTFSENNWYFEPEQGSWNIMPYSDDNVAEFVFEDYLDYSFALTSQVFSGIDCPEVELNYDISLYNYELTGEEFLSVEVTTGDEWQEITSYCNDEDDFSIFESFDISDFVAGNNFQVRFRAHGTDAFFIDSWTVDNICITDGTPMLAPHLYGHVVNAETLEPVTEAVVCIANLIQITYNENGLTGTEYGYDFAEIPAEELNLSCSAPGYCIYNETISMLMGEEMELNIMLQPNPQNLVPENLQANPSGLDAVSLNWQAVEMDEYLVESYDDGNEEFFADFQAQTNQFIANRFQFEDQIELQKTLFYIQLGMTVPWGEDPQARFYIVGEANGMPDINDQFCEPFTLDNLINENAVPAFWMEIPVSMTIPANTAFYLCMEWEQENPASQYISLGADINEPQGNSWIFIDAAATWIPLTGEMGMNAMIRCQYMPQNPDDQILNGYNVYRDGAQINSEIVNQTTYLDSGLAAGEYSYQVSALYNNNESDLSVPCVIETGSLPAPHLVNASLNIWNEPRVDVHWQVNNFPGLQLTGFNIFRNGEQLNEELLPVFPRIYEDTDIVNGEHHSYDITAVYSEGESEHSITGEIDILFPAQNCYAIPWDEYIEIVWESPVEPVAPVEILGYNIYNIGMLLNTDPVTDLSYLDYDFIDNNEYWVTTVYSSGESQASTFMAVEGGIQVINPPDSLAAEISDQNVILTWNRPDGNGAWHHWDNDDIGESFGLDDNTEFTAVVEFDEWDLLEYGNHLASSIAFYPTENADYTVTIWTNDFMNPSQYMINETIEVTDYQLNDWNIIPIFEISVVQTFTKVRIGITCNNYSEAPLACDMGPNVSEKSDMLLAGDQWTNLSSDHGLDANWKVRLFLQEIAGGGPCRERLNSFELISYCIYRNDELLNEIAAVNGIFTDPELSPGDYEYSVTCKYNVAEIAVIESEPCESVTVLIEEPFYPAPQQFNAEITDYNKVVLSWEMPEPRPAYTASDTTHNLRGNTEAIELRDRELSAFYVYCDSIPVDTLSADQFSWTHSSLAPGTYSHQVAAVYEGNTSELTPASQSVIELPAPVQLSGELSDNNVILTWEMPHPEWEVLSFVIYRNSQFLAAEIPEYQYIDDDITIGTYYYQVKAVFSGNYQSEMSEPFEMSVTDSENNLLPKVTELQGNYPNPFNPVTTISFSLANAENVVLNIYNIKGELVNSLINEEMPAGYYNIEWAGTNDHNRNVSSGIYLYRIQAGKYHALKKMSLLK